MKIGGIEVWATVKDTVKQFLDRDLQGMAAEITYHLLFSLVPLLIFLTSLSAFVGQQIGVGNVISQLTGWLRTDANLPESTVDVVLEPIEQVLVSQSGGLLSVGALLALWGGKNAIMALMKGLNVAYGVKETRPWWITWAIAIGLTIALGLTAIVASLFYITSTAVGEQVAGELDLTNTWATVWTQLRVPLLVGLLAVMVSFFYWVGPDRRSRYQFISIGSLFTVLLWGVVTMGLGLYFQYMGGYVSAYGILGGLLGFMFWLFVMSLVLLFGGLLNAVIHRQRAAAAMPAGALPAGLPPATRVDGLPGRMPERLPGRLGWAQRAGPELPSPPLPAPVHVHSSILDTVRGRVGPLPSAEDAARREQIARYTVDHEQRTKTAGRLLAASFLAALSAIAVGLRGRS